MHDIFDRLGFLSSLLDPINIRVVKRNPGLDPIDSLGIYLVIYAWIR